MFSSIGLFKKIKCPLQDECKLHSQCLFSHDDDDAAEKNIAKPIESQDSQMAVRPIKKRRLVSSHQVTKQSKPSPAAKQTLPHQTEHSISGAQYKNELSKAESNSKQGHQRAISPPPLKRGAGRAETSANNDKSQHENPAVANETLNPRVMTNPPAPHSSRTLYLRKLHESYARLNSNVASSDDPGIKLLQLSEGQLISMAVDEEQKIAGESSVVYPNVIKLRIAKLMKMTPEQWKLERQAQKGNESAKVVPKENPIVTNLSPWREISVLRHLVATEAALKKYDFMISVPTSFEIWKAEDALWITYGWEQCDRCKTRFRVFKERDLEDGSLTSGGECSYHPGRIQSPENAELGQKTYSCCNAPVGGNITGCDYHKTHVFKFQDSGRLASVCQFKEAPENPDARGAVSFDCEMGYTQYGMELIRLTALSWPEGEVLLDVLVQPLGIVLDFNTRFSGVRPEHFRDSVPYGTATQQAPGTKRLEKVNSPMAARDLLFKLISPSTVLVGHSLENDLRAARIVHRNIVDSVMLYPHRRGPPYRLALKKITREYLEREIQEDASGHDPQEDAKAAGDMVRLKVEREWRSLQSEGWTFLNEDSDQLVPPKSGMGGPLGAAQKRRY